MSDAAIASIVTGLVTIATLTIGFLTLWVKLKYGVGKAEEAASKAEVVEVKIDQNTKLTKEGTEQAAKHAKDAAEKAVELSKQMNGALDIRINEIVRKHMEPFLTVFKAHSEQDDANMREIRDALEALKKQQSK